MPQDPFPDPGCDGEETDRSVPPPAASSQPGRAQPPEGDQDADATIDGLTAGADGDWAEDPPDGPEQGLFVCLPTEELDVARFAQGGQADGVVPGPLLAAVVHALAGPDGEGLAALSDDQLIGIIGAARRLESRIAWMQLAAVREFAARRPASKDRAGQQATGGAGTGFSEFAADELVSVFHLSWQSAAEQIAFACQVAERLPRTFAALAAGAIHPVHAKIIEDVTRVLSDADAARADEILSEAAQSKTFGELRAAAHRLVLKLDPDAARRRKEAARQDAHVRRFREQSGNAGMIARELPPDEVLASWQHVDQRARDLRAAGMPGTLQELRVRAYLDLLQERDSRTGRIGPDAQETGGQPSGNDAPQDGSDGPGGNPEPDDRGPGGSGGDGGPAGDPAGTGGNGHARPGTGPSVAALINMTVPLSALTGQSGTPADVAGFGLLDPDTARDLVAAAARHPRTRWCLTALHPDGTAAAHGCAAGRHSWPEGQPEGEQTAQFVRALKLILNTVIRGPCDHAQAQRGYRPSRQLQHLVNTRSARCTAPGCGRPATRCDLDHTKPWHHGGITCPCNLAPLCRHHHRCKQAEGWWLEQPEPGVLVWHTPSGRTYATAPTEYPT
jgi:hypothetical protein